jgi:hypothetical protein
MHDLAWFCMLQSHGNSYSQPEETVLCDKWDTPTRFNRATTFSMRFL